MKATLLKWIMQLTPQRQLTVFMVLAITSLFAWVKILTGNVRTDCKTALADCKKNCSEETRVLKIRVNTLELKIDSILKQQAYDDKQTIIKLQEMLDKSRVIKNEIKKRK